MRVGVCFSSVLLGGGAVWASFQFECFLVPGGGIPCFSLPSFSPPCPIPHVCLNSDNERVDFFMSEMADFFRRKACMYLCMGLLNIQISSWNYFTGKSPPKLFLYSQPPLLTVFFLSSKTREGGQNRRKSLRELLK